MSSRALFLLLFCLTAASLGAADWSSFVASSDRRDDPLILSFLEGADLETSLQLCEALGSRSEPYAADILAWLLSGYSKTTEYRSEYLLRIAMKSLFDASRGDQTVRARLEANAAVLDEMVSDLARFDDPQLIGLIVGLLPGIGSPHGLPALMGVGERLVDRLSRTAGFLSPTERSLALDYLGAAERIGTKDFLEQCIAIARLSRDSDLVREARKASLILAGR